VAILQALISLITRSAGKILNAIFGWAVLALFGQTSPKEQTMLSAVVAAAAAWPLLVLGIVVPRVTLFVVSFVPLSKSVPSLWLRIIWIALALLVPIVVGSVIASRSPPSSLPEPRWKKFLRGFQVTFALAVAFLLMLVVAPVLKIVNAAKRQIDVRLPLLVKKGVGAELVDALVTAIAAAGTELRPGEPPWSMTAPSGVLRRLGGRAFAAFVSEKTFYHHGDGLEVNLNPNELLLRGKPDRVVRAQTLAQEVIAPRDALMTMNAEARALEQQIKRVWAVYAEDPEHHRESRALTSRVDDIARELSKRDLPFDEWQIVYRELLQLDRALGGERPLLAQEEVMADEKRIPAVSQRVALPPASSVPARIESMSNKELVQHIVQNATLLAKKEIELAKAELKADLKNEIAMAKGLTVAGLCAIWTVSMMLVAVALALGKVMPEWAAALVVAAAVLLVGTVAGLVGWGKRVKEPLETTRRTLKEDVQWAKERIA
jgi:Putative Actinobacterial Holin-X, holin superfamily III